MLRQYAWPVVMDAYCELFSCLLDKADGAEGTIRIYTDAACWFACRGGAGCR